MRLFLSNLRKLIRRPASFVSLGVLVGLIGLILILVGLTARQAEAQGNGGEAALLLLTFPGAYIVVLSFVLGTSGLFAVIYAAAVAGSEWSWGTLKSAVARGESRTIYQLAQFAAIALLIGLGLVITFLAGVLLAIVGAGLADVPTTGIDDPETLGTIPELLGRAWLAVVGEGAIGFAIATLARSQLAGIGAGIGVYIGGNLASLFIPQIVKYLPFQAADAMVEVPSGFGGGGGGGSLVEQLDPNTALLVVVAWLVGALVVASLFTERAEITG